MVPADLVYVTDDQPGITRQKRGRGFSYIAPDGTTIAGGVERQRLEALGVPPAYEDVWICPLHNGHLQATGRDVRKRKQYRYHMEWTAAQAETKFAGLVNFGDALPRIRRRVLRDLEGEAGEQSFALASAVALIDRTAMRVGHPDYARENGSYGALTLLGKHVRLDGNTIHLRFKAKGGKKVRRRMNDRTLARILTKINDLPGAEVLGWIDDQGTSHSLSSSGLNTYLCDASGTEGVTAKTFRTWTGTLAAYEVAEKAPATIKEMAQAAADRLHNTPSIARSSYIHPAVIDLAGEDVKRPDVQSKSGLYAAEARLLDYLKNS